MKEYYYQDSHFQCFLGMGSRETIVRNWVLLFLKEAKELESRVDCRESRYLEG